MAKKRLCLTCGRKLQKGEKTWCLDCNLKHLKEIQNPEKVKEKIWQEIEEQVKENKQE